MALKISSLMLSLRATTLPTMETLFQTAVPTTATAETTSQTTIPTAIIITMAAGSSRSSSTTHRIPAITASIPTAPMRMHRVTARTAAQRHSARTAALPLITVHIINRKNPTAGTMKTISLNSRAKRKNPRSIAA